jgi:hypothetical protein
MNWSTITGAQSIKLVHHSRQALRAHLTGLLTFRWVRGQRKRQGKQAVSRRALKCAKTLRILQLRILQRNMGLLKQRLRLVPAQRGPGRENARARN